MELSQSNVSLSDIGEKLGIEKGNTVAMSSLYEEDIQQRGRSINGIPQRGQGNRPVVPLGIGLFRGKLVQSLNKYIFHIFKNGSNILNVSKKGKADILVVGGGGSGSKHSGWWEAAAGGGAGGLIYYPNYDLPLGDIICNVGSGGNGVSGSGIIFGNKGQDSIFNINNNISNISWSDESNINKVSGGIFNLESSIGEDLAYSKNGKYLATVQRGADIVLYHCSNGNWSDNTNNNITKYKGGVYRVNNNSYGIDFSSNGNYMAIAHASGNHISLFYSSDGKWENTNNVSKYTGGVYNFSNTGWTVKFSPDNNYMFVGHTWGSGITLFHCKDGNWHITSNNNVVKYTEGIYSVEGTARGLAFDSTGKYLAVSHTSSPNFSIYYSNDGKWENTNNVIKYSGGIYSVPGSSLRVAFSPDEYYIAITHNNDNGITILHSQDKDWTNMNNVNKYTGGIYNVSGNGRGVSFSPDGNYLAIGHTNDNFISIFKSNNGSWDDTTNISKYSGGVYNLNGSGLGTSFSVDGRTLSVAHSGGACITMFNYIGDNTLIALGGGGGGRTNSVFDGGSGGGRHSGTIDNGGIGMQPNMNGKSGVYGYGNNGGGVISTSERDAGSGGGAGGSGRGNREYGIEQTGSSQEFWGAPGGAGKYINGFEGILNQSHDGWFAGGGGAAAERNRPEGIGGRGGGGNGGRYSLEATSGISNTGGGGGGCSHEHSNRVSGSGGSGVIIVRYLSSEVIASGGDIIEKDIN